MEAMDTGFPSQGNLEALRRKLRPERENQGYRMASLTNEEEWQWHAYDYGLRRVFLNDDQRPSPIDTQGIWFDDSLVREAVNFFRRKKRARPDYVSPPKPTEHVIRSNWKSLRRDDLTSAELALADPEIERMAQKARALFADASERWDRARRGVRGEQPRGPSAREIPPPPPLADAEDPGVREWMRRLGETL